MFTISKGGGVVYNISYNEPTHQKCADALSLYNLPSNEIYSITNDEIDPEKVQQHIEYFEIVDSGDTVHYIWLDNLIHDGDRYSSKKFSPNPETGHYFDGKSLTSYTQYYEEEIKEFIKQEVAGRCNLERIKSDLPQYLTAKTGGTLTIDGKEITVKTNSVYKDDATLKNYMENAIIELTKEYYKTS